jgi:hypothetical protein
MKYKFVRQYNKKSQRFTIVQCGNTAVVRDREEVCTEPMSPNDAKRAMRRFMKECRA